MSLFILTVLILACLVPFIDKAFHIDDPLFVWSARHIQSHPGDFYGFMVNWEGSKKPLWSTMQNPPLACYYMEPAGALFGWNEVALHAWFLWPALALGIGTFILARRFCSHALAAALITVTAPVFLISSTGLMCDTLMMAFWVWAIVFWLDGLGEGSQAKLGVAALLIAACELTKYFGVSLIALLLVYSLLEKRRPGAWLGWLLAPVLILLIYHWITGRLYGRGLLFNAVVYATKGRTGGGLTERILTSLAFGGGCILIFAPLAPFLWGRKMLAGGALAVLLTGLLVVSVKSLNQFSVLQNGQIKWFYVAQLSLAAVIGASLIALAAADWFESKTPLSILLFLWIAGTFYFAGAVNWTISGRNILPMLPAVSILAVRRLERRNGNRFHDVMVRLTVPLACALVIALLVSCADYRLANSARDEAAILMRKTAPVRVWFEGHWGFQYYMEELGGKAVDLNHIHLAPGDALAVPGANYGVSRPESYHFAFWFRSEGDTLTWLSTMSGAAGAGYYSDLAGHLPFAFGAVPPDQYMVLTVR